MIKTETGLLLKAMKRKLGAILPVSLQRNVRRGLSEWRSARFRPYLTSHKVFGVNLNIYIADSIGKEWYDHDQDKVPFVRHYETSLASSRLILYIGAHYGVYANAFARMSRGKVVSVEASPKAYAAAIKNIEVTQPIGHVCIHAAISDKTGWVEFTHGCQASTGDPGIPTVKVPAVTIDDLVTTHGRPGWIILDVEGYEQKALSGASETLKDGSISWWVEVHNGCGLQTFGGSLAGILEKFEGRDLMMCRDSGSDGVMRFSHLDPLSRERFHLIAPAA